VARWETYKLSVGYGGFLQRKDEIVETDKLKMRIVL
jgi:hypothetical protein